MANGSNSGITFAKIRSGNGKWVLDNQTNLPEIRTLQSALFFAGYWSGKGDTRDGCYNAQTVSAVKGFQVIKNISPANGEFDQTTLKAGRAHSPQREAQHRPYSISAGVLNTPKWVIPAPLSPLFEGC